MSGQDEKTVQEKDILGYNFFRYGMPFIGECGGMHYYIAREPLENVVYNHDPHSNDHAALKATIWRGPLNYEKTEQEKISENFPFTPEGRLCAIDWLKEQYAKRPDYWAEGIPLFPTYTKQLTNGNS